jgi:hypothetical protein
MNTTLSRPLCCAAVQPGPRIQVTSIRCSNLGLARRTRERAVRMLCHHAVGADVHPGVEAVAQRLEIDSVLHDDVLCGVRPSVFTCAEQISAAYVADVGIP